MNVRGFTHKPVQRITVQLLVHEDGVQVDAVLSTLPFLFIELVGFYNYIVSFCQH